jgi:hypothetical protein
LEFSERFLDESARTDAEKMAEGDVSGCEFPQIRPRIPNAERRRRSVEFRCLTPVYLYVPAVYRANPLGFPVNQLGHCGNAIILGLG